jgi:hypothetical protein
MTKLERLSEEEIAAMEKTSEGLAEASGDDLKRISTLTAEVLEVADQVAQMEEQLKEKKEELRKLRDEKLPDLMRNELGLETVTLASGETLTVKPAFGCSITEANKAKAHKWLRDNGFGDLIKNQVTVSFGRDEDKVAEVCMRMVELLFAIKPANKVGVHSNTLKAFVKEQKGKGVTLPDSISVHEYFVVDIKTK